MAKYELPGSFLAPFIHLAVLYFNNIQFLIVLRTVVHDMQL